MKEVMAVIRMDKVNLTKKALLDVGIPGFSAISVKGRGKLVEDPSVIEGRKETILALGRSKEDEKAEKMVVEFLDGISSITIVSLGTPMAKTSKISMSSGNSRSFFSF